MENLIIGTRGSQLAQVQTRWVEGKIAALFPEIRIIIKIIATSADKDAKTSIRSATATGVFVREIEDALLAKDIDLAVHSMKDLPTKIPDGLAIGAIPEREDVRDALIMGQNRRALSDLPAGSVVGTGSVRRQAQLLARRPDLVARDIRGNVGTRLQKLDSGNYDAIVLACAGLKRLSLESRIRMPFSLAEMLPAPGQGALALEIRAADDRISRLVTPLNDSAASAAVLAERAFLRTMGGGCNSPIAVHARPHGDGFLIEGLVALPDGTRLIRDAAQCADAGSLECATALAQALLSRGGAEILKAAR